MKVSIQPSVTGGVITAPASKSAMQRVCALALLNTGVTVIKNPGKSNDDLAALDIIRQLGVIVNSPACQTGEEAEIIIRSPGLIPGATKEKQINCGESGLSLRMFTPIAALYEEEISITGSGSLLNRPVDLFDEKFPMLGVSILSNKGKLPLKIKGPLIPEDITIDGSLSSQFLTGLLMAFAKSAQKNVTITVTDLKSKPYIDLTLQMMKHFGYEVRNDDYKRFFIGKQVIADSRKAGNIQSPVSDLPSKTYTVEGDWSGAAFLLVAGAIAGTITVKGLDVFSAQADKGILQALMMFGAVLSIEEKQITVGPPPGGRGKAFHFNATDCPDLFPPLVVLAAYCEGISVIEGVHRLAYKESNRAISLRDEFNKMGVEIRSQDDLMLVTGSPVSGAAVHSHHDHRIAMACAIAGLKASGETVIAEAGAVDKSYPDFYRHLKMLGANVSLPVNNKP